MTNLWVDDQRPSPEGWEWVDTYQKAIDALTSIDVEAISLDHDLSEDHYVQFFNDMNYSDETGYDIIKFMEANNIWPEVIGVHSANPVGRERIKRVIEDSMLYNGPSSGSIGQWGTVDLYFRQKDNNAIERVQT